MTERILVAGIGNIFMGDDAFGIEVAQRLLSREPAEGVRVVDFGIREIDLAYALTDGYEATILVDATPRGGIPGTLYTIEAELESLEAPDVFSWDAHGMNPVTVLRLVKAMGGDLKRVFVVGCEPEPMSEEDDGKMGLSAPVAAAVDPAVEVVESLVANLLAEPRQASSEIQDVHPKTYESR